MRKARPLAIVGNGPEPVEPVPAGGEHAIFALKALAQPARMEIFRMVNAEADGVPARVIAARIGGPHSVASMHLAVLTKARLLTGRRAADVVTYHANPEALQAVVDYLTGSGA